MLLNEGLEEAGLQLPLVCAFFIDLVNALLIPLMLANF